MSNRRRPREKRHRAATPASINASRSHTPRPEPGPGEEYAMQPVLVPDRHEPGSREFARQVSHDTLIDIWGELRRTGIWWSEHLGAEGARAFRSMLEATETPITDEEEQLLAESADRLLVVTAWAIVKQGDPPGYDPKNARAWVTEEPT